MGLRTPQGRLTMRLLQHAAGTGALQSVYTHIARRSRMGATNEFARCCRKALTFCECVSVYYASQVSRMHAQASVAFW